MPNTAPAATILPPAETCFQALTPTSGGPSNTGSGMVGKFVEPGGLVMVTWDFACEPVDTGFRPQGSQDRPRLLEALAAYGTAQTSETPHEGAASASQNQETAP